MLLFFTCVFLLIAGYFIYGKFVESVFDINEDRLTPAYLQADGVDFVAMPPWKLLLIQLLDVAGMSLIFGPILGALYGPQALLWVVFGSIFAGAAHDFFSGMLSVQNKGQTVPEIVGNIMGTPARHIARLFSMVLLVLVGVVLVLGPAEMLGALTGISPTSFVLAIFGYYFLATILPVNTLLGRLYPIFGGLLVLLTLAMIGGLVFEGYELLPNQDFLANTHPDNQPLWPLLFVVLAGGAISGFNATQTPLVARCLKTEKDARSVFYGAAIIKGIIALIWVTVGLSFYQSPEAMNEMIFSGSLGEVVGNVATTLFGPVGGTLAVIGIVILAITSGDTAFRSIRLILAESFKTSQKPISGRLLMSVPVLVIGYLISTLNFAVDWYYFGWANQAFATLVLWASAVYLAKEGKLGQHWIASLPASLMTAICVTFIAYAPAAFGAPYKIAVLLGLLTAGLSFATFMIKAHTWQKPHSVFLART